jgi:carbonic anhydrase/acetyltransferase-like protein (isoleucine patch superfamily)
VVGAGALVTEGTVIPDNSLVLGSPAKVKGEITEDLLKDISHSAEHYVESIGKYNRLLKEQK